MRGHMRSLSYRWALPLAMLAVLSLATPTLAFEREGEVTYFSLEDLHLDLQHLFQRDTWASFVPSMNWQTLQTNQDQYENGPIERSMRWGNGRGVDGYRLPGMRPLWGY